jgi:hypothetical protein
MKEIKRYQTEDGKIHDTEELAAAHETLVARVAEITSALGPRSDEINNGAGYVQHDPAVVEKIKASFHLVALKTQGFDDPDENGAPDEHFIGRWLNDSNSFLYGVWNRLACIDELGREFDQQFFRNNPHKCAMKEFKS